MTKPRTRLARAVPEPLRPFAKRQLRRLDRLAGLPRSGRRPGVVLMLHVGRCGSTVLADLLGQHPRIHWDGKLPRIARDLYGRAFASLDFPDWTRRQFAISGDRFYGFEFKILADQYPAMIGMTTPEFLAACRKIGVTHYVLLVRRNTLRHVVSHYASKNRGRWHASAGETVRSGTFTLDLADVTTGSAPGRGLVDYIREVEAAHEAVRRGLDGERLLEIEYERDIDEKGADHAYRRICDFLGLAPAAADIRRARMAPQPIAGLVENFDEVRAALEGTGYDWMARS